MKAGLEEWRIRQGWESFTYLDKPRSYYDADKKDVIILDPATGKNTKRQYKKKSKEK